MNELLIDYTNKEKLSPRRKKTMIIAGSIFITLALIIAIIGIVEDFTIALLASALCQVVIGVIFILQGMEHQMLSPRKYIKISGDGIEYKIRTTKPVENIRWESLQGIEIGTKAIQFIRHEKRTILKMIHFPSSDEKKIKGLLTAIGQEKDLLVK